MSDGKGDYAQAPDHGGTHKDPQPQGVKGGASTSAAPSSSDDPKGETIPGFDPADQPAFASQKPGAGDGSNIVSQVVGSFARGGAGGAE